MSWVEVTRGNTFIRWDPYVAQPTTLTWDSVGQCSWDSGATTWDDGLTSWDDPPATWIA